MDDNGNPGQDAAALEQGGKCSGAAAVACDAMLSWDPRPRPRRPRAVAAACPCLGRRPGARRELLAARDSAREPAQAERSSRHEAWVAMASSAVSHAAAAQT
eukprot:359097-Chlamydomonas_euryale.AAC.2